MCGILGGNIPDWNYEAGIHSMYHRGPDGNRVRRFGDVILAFTRLSIMDLSERAMQPMDSEDGKVHIVYNGEIYGFGPLRTKLKQKYHFKTTSDTEVILMSYLEYGDSFIEHIDGMFAISIFDERKGTIKLYRDRSGIKPLYYYCEGNRFAFSSELKGLVNAANRKFDVDYTAIYDYLMYQYIPEPKSMYKNIFKLPPAFMLEYDVTHNKVIRRERYWKLRVNTSVDRVRSQEDISEQLHCLIKKSIKDQMVADVPVGTFLSGGVDSSIVTYEASQLKPDVWAFSIGFEDKENDESGYAQILTDKYNLNVSKRILSVNDVQRIKGQLKQWYDEPFADTSAYPTYRVSSLAKEKVTVVLTGDGGDELFGGYNRYKSFLSQVSGVKHDNPTIYRRMMQLYQRYGIMSLDFIESFKTEFDVYSEMMGVRYNDAVQELARRWDIPRDYDPKWALSRYYNKELPPLTRMRYLDFKTYMVGDVLTKVDRASMQVSLETRVPFLSRDIIEFAFSLSQEECCPKDELKGCLKKAYEGAIPDEILYRYKMGFAIPMKAMRKEGREGNIYLGILKDEWKELAC